MPHAAPTHRLPKPDRASGSDRNLGQIGGCCHLVEGGDRSANPLANPRPRKGPHRPARAGQRTRPDLRRSHRNERAGRLVKLFQGGNTGSNPVGGASDRFRREHDRIGVPSSKPDLSGRLRRRGPRFSDGADASAEPPRRRSVIATPSREPAAASLPRRVRGYITAWPTGRTCAASDCETSLSRYNKDTLCWRHGEERDANATRARR
jgi:hypothetical protein